MPSFRDSPNGVLPVSSTNPILERDQSQWLFTPSELLRSPSILDGMPAVQELANRQKGVNFITQVGIMLKLPQLTLATASVYLHRLFMRQKMPTEKSPGLHHYSAAATALFLATKVEENCRKMRELVVACCRVAQKQPNLVVDEQNKEYWKWRDTILHNEDVLLEALCFDLQLEQPYRILFEFLQYYGVQDHKNLRNTSWAFLNDSHVTTMCLLHTPRAIAGAALYTGIRLTNITLPDDEQGRPWWEHLELDVVEIQQACNLMFDVYENPTLPRVGAKDAYIKEDDMSFLERTRGLHSPQTDMSPSRSVRSVSQLSGTKRDRDDADGTQDEEWGAARIPSNADQQPRSPKRQRVDTPEADRQPPSRVPPTAISRIPPGATNGSGSRVPSRIPPAAQQALPPRPPPPAAAAAADSSSVDDVQQRIDDIINASTSPQNRSSNVPALSQQIQGYHHSRRRSAAETPTLPRRPSREVDTRADDGGSRLPPTNGGGTGNSEEGRSKQEEIPPARSAPVNEARRQNGDRSPPGSAADRAAQPADEVDYGSEEGEV